VPQNNTTKTLMYIRNEYEKYVRPFPRLHDVSGAREAGLEMWATFQGGAAHVAIDPNTCTLID
jgi:hypothetical protein